VIVKSLIVKSLSSTIFYSIKMVSIKLQTEFGLKKEKKNVFHRPPYVSFILKL